VRELGIVLRATVIDRSATPEQGYNLADLLNPQAVGSELRVRNWRAGDRFWPAHTKAPKKLKELLQSRHVSGCERVLWPVAANSAGELVWLRGFSVPERFAAGAEDSTVIVVQEVRSSK
jgi:tRNA(Ile)-lysidine synthetase-like protein